MNSPLAAGVQCTSPFYSGSAAAGKRRSAAPGAPQEGRTRRIRPSPCLSLRRRLGALGRPGTGGTGEPLLHIFVELGAVSRHAQPLQEGGGSVHRRDLEAPAGELQGMPPHPARQVQHRRSGRLAEEHTTELDKLLSGAAFAAEARRPVRFACPDGLLYAVTGAGKTVKWRDCGPATVPKAAGTIARRLAAWTPF